MSLTRKAEKAMSFPRRAKKATYFHIKLVAFKSYVHPKKAKNAVIVKNAMSALNATS